MSFPQMLLNGAVQSTALLLLAGLIARRLPTPERRHQVRLIAVSMLPALPIFWLLVPAFGWERLAKLLPGQELVGVATGAGGAAAGELPAFSFLAGADAQVAAAQAFPIGLAISCAWAAVALATAAGALSGHLAARRIAARSVGSPWKFGDIPVRLSDGVTAPAAVGMRRPIILLPRSALGWTSAKVQAALAHEAAHIGRRDLASALAADIACCLYWFNPLAWRARAALSLDRELACDARVLAGGIAPADYADALIAAARAVKGLPPRETLAMASTSEVESRVRYILEAAPEAKERSRFGRLPTALLILSMPLLAALRPADQPLEPLSQERPDPLGTQPVDMVLLNPRSELIAMDYEALARAAAQMPAAGADAAAIARLKAHLDRRPEGIDDLVRERAIWTLSRMRGRSLLEPLLEDLGSPDWRVRAYATWGLAVLRSPRATPHLAALLRDPVWRVRAGAAAAIEELGDRSARPAMAAALSDEAWQVRYSAIEYFAQDPDPAERLRLHALTQDPHNGTRQLAREALRERR